MLHYIIVFADVGVPIVTMRAMMHSHGCNKEGTYLRRNHEVEVSLRNAVRLTGSEFLVQFFLDKRLTSVAIFTEGK